MAQGRRTSRWLLVLGTVGIGASLVVLGCVYLVSRLISVAFGDLLFALSVLTAAAWVLFAVRGQRIDAARPASELIRNSATDYGREVSRGTLTLLSHPIGILVVLTVTLVLGWALVIVTA